VIYSARHEQLALGIKNETCIQAVDPTHDIHG
jgi:hypothetical protein